MSSIKCNFQKFVRPIDKLRAVVQGTCDHCEATTASLAREGKTLEVCGAEYMTDPITAEREFELLTLCPDCHRAQHLDADGNHNPCQVKARNSRELS